MRRNLRILWLALVLAIAAVAAVPPARADMTRPTWSLGDYWEYHLQQTSILINTDGRSRMTVAGTETVQVQGNNYPSWRLQTVTNLTMTGFLDMWVNMSGSSWYRVSDLALVKQSLGGTYEYLGFTFPATQTVEWNRPQDIQWPLMTGNTWSTAGWMNTTLVLGGIPSYMNSTVTANWAVEAEQSVTVPAGTFTTTPLNGTDPSGSFNVTYWSPTAGNYVWMRSFDSAGAQLQTLELTAYQYQFLSDTQPPSITGVSTTPAAPVAGVDSVTIAATVTDDGQVAAVFVNVMQPDAVSVNRSMTAGTGNRWSDVSVWNQVGAHTFVIWASDATGKWASASGSFTTVSPDTAPPVIAHTQPVGPFYPDATIRIEATVTDAGSGVDTVRIDYTDVAGTRRNLTMTLQSGTTYAYTIPAQNTTGTVRYRIYAIDLAGNAKMTQEHTLTVEARPEPLNVVLIGGIGIVILVVVVIAALLVSRRRKKAAPPSPPQMSPPPP